ncbi:hypothetical protein J8F10_24655 [Gemmata sp. G18]|uniref:Response regulatory domain-containing protein n=1 Tax=Gemmata palustris TaxID=2822762 RepID=A0ABS5BYG6_9BACT|nr:hypothetical protein [Gemmata palustris]MBP3958452.1 hypothetical protein [Gemmata palustris]
MPTLLVGPTRQNLLLSRLGDLLQSRPGVGGLELVTFDRAAERAQKGGFELVFVILASDCVAESLEVVRALRATGTHVLVVGPATDPKLILGAMQAGGDRFLDQDELEPALDSELTRLNLTSGAEARQLIGVLSASGGCGASTIAVNLAVVLAKKYGRCNLIDLNVNKADLAPLLDLKPQYTLSNLCQNEDRLDRTMYEKLLTIHPSGTALLAGPRFHEEARALTIYGVEQAVSLACEAFSQVVVDLEDCIHDEQVAVLGRADRILLVCRLDFTAIRNARRAMDHLAARGVPRDRIEVVMNHTGLPNELSVDDAEMALGVKVTHLIPHAPGEMGWATNVGIPAALKDDRAPVVQSIAKLVGLDAPVPPAPDLRARFGAFYRERVLPWVRTLRARFNSPAPVPAPPLAAETKVCYEPISPPEPAADSRACAF